MFAEHPLRPLLTRWKIRRGRTKGREAERELTKLEVQKSSIKSIKNESKEVLNEKSQKK